MNLHVCSALDCMHEKLSGGIRLAGSLDHTYSKAEKSKTPRIRAPVLNLEARKV